MPLYLLAPGERVKTVKGKRYVNRYYYIRGEIAGRTFDVSTKTTNLATAQALKAALELDTLRNAPPALGDDVTFEKAANAYLAYRNPNKEDRRVLSRIVAAIGDRLLREITMATLVDLANLLYPNGSNATKNRSVLTPAAAVLHYAAENKWCEWLKVRKLNTGPRTTRATSLETGQQIIAALEAELAEAKTERLKMLARKKRLLVAWLFSHGNRITDPLRLDWSQIDLERRTYLLYVAKGKKWRTKPIDDDIFPLLANEPNKEGFVFPWRTRYGVYKWLRPLCRRLGV